MAGIIDLTAPEAEAGSGDALPEVIADVEAADPFPVDAMPKVLGRMAEAIADVGGVPLGMSAPLVLAAASAAIGRGVRVKALQGRETRASLYLMMGKQSGSGGSGAYRLAMAPLHGFQAAECRGFEGGIS